MSAAPAAPGALRFRELSSADVCARGLVTVADVLAQSECVRDLPDRSNHVLTVGEQRFFVKRTKPRGLFRRLPPEPPEAVGLARLAAAGVPCPRVAFVGRDPRLGCLTATFDLAPAEPLDDLVRTGRIAPGQMERLIDRLGDLVAGLHAEGLHHRDLYLNHIYCDPDGLGLTLIDAERVASHRGALGRHEVKDLAALEASGPPGLWSETTRARFLTRYLTARGLDPRVLPRLTARVLSKAARMRAHIPRTPVGPAARP